MAKQTFTTGQVLTAAQMTSLQQTAMGGGSATAKTASYVLTAADAGTTVIMNAAGATTITVNTALFAAGDTVNIQNIGAGVCTVTAGTATVNTAGSLALGQYEGGVLYFVSTSVATYFDYFQAGGTTPLTTKGDLFGFDTANARIPIGTNNQVLTADSAQALGLKWAAVPAAAKSYSLISSTSLTGSSVTVSSLSGYDNFLFLVVDGRSNTGGSTIAFRINGDSGAGKYEAYGAGLSGDASYASSILGRASVLGSSLTLGISSNNAAGYFGGGINLTGGNSTGFKTYQVSMGMAAGGGSAQFSNIMGGVYKGTAVISSVTIICSGGTFNNGTLDIYGAV